MAAVRRCVNLEAVNKYTFSSQCRLLLCYKNSTLLFRTVRNRSNDSSSTDSGETSNLTESKLGGFAKAFQKYTAPADTEKRAQPVETFVSLLRNSKFVDLGDPQGKIVYGKIFHTVNEDLYIDFGWKFHCVCQRPARNGSEYVRGAKVRLRINELELSSKFLGSSKDLTLLEADCTLLGLVSSPARVQHQN